MEHSGGGSDRARVKANEEVDNTKDGEKSGNSTQKVPSSRLKERWLMTRKTWRYMTDAGKKLFPDGAHPQRPADVPKVHEQFQKVCSKSKDFILWPHQGQPSQDSHQYDHCKSSQSHCSKSVQSTKEKRRPANLENISIDNSSESPSLPCSPTQGQFSHGDYHSSGRERRSSSSDVSWLIPPEIYSKLIRCYGTNTLQHVASRLLEEQFMEEDEYEYEDEEGAEIIEIDGKRMRSIGAQTDSHLDMCVQTDHDDSAEDMVKVGAETRAETEAAFALAQAQKREAEAIEFEKKADEQTLGTDRQGSTKISKNPRTIQQQQTEPAPLYQKETPVLKKFWGRRESKGNEQQMAQPHSSPTEKNKGLASEKDREAPPPKGGVAAKLATLEAANTPQTSQSSSKTPKAQTSQKSPQVPAPSPQQEKLNPREGEKKSLKNVFKLGLKCDIEQSDGSKKALEKQNTDKFRTVNYDKALRNIKSKWTKEDDEILRQMLAEQQMGEVKVDPPKDIPKKKKKSRGIQVGEALPQFILSAFRVSSPVEIFYATRRRIRRRSSKAESTDFSGSEGSASLASSMPTSPRYSIVVGDESGQKNLLVSEAEAMRLSQMGLPVYPKRASFDAESDISGVCHREQPHMAGLFQRSLSAQQTFGATGPLGYLGGPSGRYPHISRSHRASLLQYLLPAVMQRSRTGGGSGVHSGSRLVAKRIWKTRSKSQSRASAATTSTWTPMGGNLWLSVTGLVVTLEASSLLHLCEIERHALQRLALAKLAALNLGCSVTIPKESSSTSSKKKRPYLLKRKALSAGFFDKKDENKDHMTGSGTSSTGGQVFGLPLSKCIENERQRQQQVAELNAAVAASLSAVAAAAEEVDGRLSRKSSRAGSHASFSSLADGAKQSSTGSLESLNLDRKRPSLISGDLVASGGPCLSDLLQVEAPLSQVPYLVNTCFAHLLSYGLHTLGIFRVSSSKRRVKQLREEFDKGMEVSLTEENCPHDVAALLKEFFRDLPEPLLTRDLYEAFLSTQKIRNRKLKLEATQHLLQLLPPANRDTLYALLTFLSNVAEHAADSTSPSGETIPGNMMDSSNLATMFAPNILHLHQGGMENISTAALTAMADERTDCNNVVRSMIDHNKELFEVSAELLDEVYHHLMDSHPEALDLLLRRHAPAHDDRGQHALQQLLTSLLQPPSTVPPSPLQSNTSFSLPISPPQQTTGLDADIESGSSVFEGSECSSSLPRSPTEHLDFDKLRGGEDIPEHERLRRTDEDGHFAPRRARRRADDSKSSSGTDGRSEERGWFRRREKSSSREDRGGDDKPSERSRWFRRRDKSSRNSIDYGAKRRGSDKKMDYTLIKNDEKANESSSVRKNSVTENADPTKDPRTRSSSDQTTPKERLRVPEEVTVRRLSSPEIDACGVITASLKIPVPHSKQPSPVAAKETPIPYVDSNSQADENRMRNKETAANSRQRTGSSDSYLGQPITGTMSFQPLCKKNSDKQSHDSVLSSSSADFQTLSPSARNTPLSDVLYPSGTSSPLSGATSPPLVLSPDSGTPGLSPPPSPPPIISRRTRRTEHHAVRTVPLTHSSSHTFGPKPPTSSFYKSTRESSHGSSIPPITRSKTADVPITTSVKSGVLGLTKTSVGTEANVDKKQNRRKTTREKDGTISSQQQTDLSSTASTSTVNPPSQQVWKRCEIIASEQAEPETFV